MYHRQQHFKINLSEQQQQQLDFPANVIKFEMKQNHKKHYYYLNIYHL